jgi:hypothetical protein
MATAVVSVGNGKVRMSDAELHRQACKVLWEGNQIVFEALPTLVAQIIEHKTWRSFGKASFAEYALDATSNGLGVNTNQRLWMLRCAMDVHGEHMREWSDVLAKVEQLVKLIPIAERGAIGGKEAGFNGNSLETLAKCATSHTKRITYLPSRAGLGHDRHLLGLRKNKPDIFKRVVAGELSMVEARREAGLKVDRVTNLGRAKSAWRKMSSKERREFVAWLRDEGAL